ncbi:hypothetical protein QBC38DRAFT_504581 [Podospora fimiseda]|uniref:Uncharacterized protein n=1 Tax=Podospora fimiseda TaxID=252190 RepID=A0AAN6YSL4_9PEZI|nr:hypothetical protein QBC38DRAFT_504581 [Podospora fimiseda]
MEHWLANLTTCATSYPASRRITSFPKLKSVQGLVEVPSRFGNSDIDIEMLAKSTKTIIGVVGNTRPHAQRRFCVDSLIHRPKEEWLSNIPDKDDALSQERGIPSPYIEEFKTDDSLTTDFEYVQNEHINGPMEVVIIATKGEAIAIGITQMNQSPLSRRRTKLAFIQRSTFESLCSKYLTVVGYYWNIHGDVFGSRRGISRLYIRGLLGLLEQPFEEEAGADVDLNLPSLDKSPPFDPESSIPQWTL